MKNKPNKLSNNQIEAKLLDFLEENQKNVLNEAFKQLAAKYKGRSIEIPAHIAEAAFCQFPDTEKFSGPDVRKFFGISKNMTLALLDAWEKNGLIN